MWATRLYTINNNCSILLLINPVFHELFDFDVSIHVTNIMKGILPYIHRMTRLKNEHMSLIYNFPLIIIIIIITISCYVIN